MNYKLFLTILLILAAISTLCICIKKPQMHSSVLVYDSNYKIVEKKVDTVVEKDIPTVSQTSKPETIQTKIEEQFEQQPKTIKNETSVKTEKTETKPTEKQKIQSQTQITPQKTTEKKQIKTLTEQEEELQWNVWRSNLQNQIMKDVKLPIMPQGTVFKFEFDVDEYGKVSNVQTHSLTPQFTPYAIQYIAPVIKSYQGRSILNFPTGTQRTSTHVTGGWKISSVAKYSTPQDFNDTETIKK